MTQISEKPTAEGPARRPPPPLEDIKRAATICALISAHWLGLVALNSSNSVLDGATKKITYYIEIAVVLLTAGVLQKLYCGMKPYPYGFAMRFSGVWFAITRIVCSMYRDQWPITYLRLPDETTFSFGKLMAGYLLWFWVGFAIEFNTETFYEMLLELADWVREVRETKKEHSGRI
ncbi:hypothetical protein F5Y04DRAFT_243975 [Hypomontagnella monticulosa]|nr:hypothetical protein F5Y04DRAFT_243975 [Hypomontagnella monticulosa]